MSREVDKIIRDAGGTPPVDDAKRTLTDGSPVTEDHRNLQSNGQQKGYVVLSEDERQRGFVRPVRLSYRHVGKPPPANLRDLTAAEHAQYDQYGYLKYEEYGKERSPVLGCFWTRQMLDRLGKGCGTVTTMAQSLAETYARKPDFYGGTFCAGCSTHFPVGAAGEFVWEGTSERVGT